MDDGFNLAGNAGFGGTGAGDAGSDVDVDVEQDAVASRDLYGAVYLSSADRVRRF